MLDCARTKGRLVRFAIKLPRFSADWFAAPSHIHWIASRSDFGRGRLEYSVLHCISQSCPAAPFFFKRLVPRILVPLAVFRYTAVEETTLWLQTLAISLMDQPRDRKWLQHPVRPPRRLNLSACSCVKLWHSTRALRKKRVIMPCVMTLPL